MNKVTVECRGIGLAYGTTEVLKDVSLRIEPGEFFALLGPSGSGKSTLLRLIAGFNRHNRGQLLVDGRDITAVAPHARNIGMVFQSYALWPHMTVYDNVAFGLVERRLPRDEIRRRTEAALDLVGLPEFAQRRPHQLSGGQQQRVALARTIVIEPQVLLLDEPLSNLDKNLRVQMRQDLLALQRKLGITTIFVTHDQEEAMTTADRMAVLDAGIVQQVGTPADLFDNPINRFVAEFVGTTNFLPGRFDRTRRAFDVTGLGTIPLDRDASAISVRPHTLVLVAAGREISSDHVWFDGEVVAREFLGEFTRYGVRAGAMHLTADAPHLASEPLLAVGAKVRIGINPIEVRALPA